MGFVPVYQFLIIAYIFTFHQYTYARDVNVQSDHKPLENITRNPCTKHQRDYNVVDNQ